MGVKFGTKTILAFVLAGTIFFGLNAVAHAAVDPEATMEFTAVEGSSGRVQIRWTPVQDATAYYVYKSTDGVNWNITNVGNAQSYQDNSVTDYVNYYYKVQATDYITSIYTPTVPAYPPDTNVHGNYAENTSLCAGCHLTHSASGEKLKVATTIVNLCITCHDGTQSKYNSLTGEVRLSGGIYPAPAGPFGNLKELDYDSAVQVVAGYTYDGSQEPSNLPTSIHNLGEIVATAPGSNTAYVSTMNCTTCHNPHGSTNYRILRDDLFTAGRSTPIIVEAYAVTGATSENINYVKGNVDFCSGCHSDFHQPSGSGGVGADKTQQEGFNLSAASAGKRMHSVDMRLTAYDFNENLRYGVPLTMLSPLPTESWAGTPTVACMTCHYAHGTKEALTPNPVRNGGQSTALKRMDKMKLCRNCHQK